ncbi:DUF2949 domain-containing protein [Candidatus Gracilibacteria bacterium]|nr:DUF2949 domain-containing protein [Candidatus Gracilibacteria bacterium]NJM90649.1 DUF2949 domain-containing protein [Hydrococcus sp. RU_2_2]NJP22188.1 DUF2949 domain-containing protein [Hydrococcus sp. CRU_1_1]
MECCEDNPELIQFLLDELKVAPVAIEMAHRLCRQQRGLLPIILWRHGVLSLRQLEQTWDWLIDTPTDRSGDSCFTESSLV